MAQGKKTDVKTRVKVIAMKMENPDISSRDIGEKVGLDNTTVCDIINIDIPRLPSIDERYQKLLEGHIRIQEKIQKAKEKRIDEAEEKRKDETLDSWENTSIKTSQLFQGKNTEQIGIEVVSPEEGKKLMKLLGK